MLIWVIWKSNKPKEEHLIELGLQSLLWRENDGRNYSHGIHSDYAPGPALGLRRHCFIESHSPREWLLAFYCSRRNWDPGRLVILPGFEPGNDGLPKSQGPLILVPSLHIEFNFQAIVTGRERQLSPREYKIKPVRGYWVCSWLLLGVKPGPELQESPGNAIVPVREPHCPRWNGRGSGLSRPGKS